MIALKLGSSGKDLGSAGWGYRSDWQVGFRVYLLADKNEAFEYP